MKLIEYKRRRGHHAIELTPLIDVVFQLLIFFMVSAQFIQPETQLDLPIGKGGERPDDIAIKVELTLDGKLTLDGEGIEDREFEDRTREAAGRLGTDRIQFRGDRQIPYGRFVELMERARDAGITAFGIVKEKPRHAPQD